MEILIAVAVVVAVGALIYYNRGSKSLDINNDGKIDAADAKAAVQNVVQGVKSSADANNDGKVDVADVKVAVKQTVDTVKTSAKKTTTKAKEAVKKATSGRGRKSKAK
jgi:hypothetical protein